MSRIRRLATQPIVPRPSSVKLPYRLDIRVSKKYSGLMPSRSPIARASSELLDGLRQGLGLDGVGPRRHRLAGPAHRPHSGVAGRTAGQCLHLAQLGHRLARQVPDVRDRRFRGGALGQGRRASPSRSPSSSGGTTARSAPAGPPAGSWVSGRDARPWSGGHRDRPRSRTSEPGSTSPLRPPDVQNPRVGPCRRSTASGGRGSRSGACRPGVPSHSTSRSCSS